MTRLNSKFQISYHNVLSTSWLYWQIYLQCIKYIYNTSTKIYYWYFWKNSNFLNKIVIKFLYEIRRQNIFKVVEIIKLRLFNHMLFLYVIFEIIYSN